MTDAHEERETLSVEVNIPAHADRTTTALFRRTREALIARDKCCYVSGEMDELQAHHFPIERSLANMIDWSLVRADAEAGELGISGAQREAAKAFDWDGFLSATPFNPYAFVDNMLTNGLLLSERFHIGKDEGIHTLPHPLWIAQRYGRAGYKFSDVEIIHHAQFAKR